MIGCAILRLQPVVPGESGGHERDLSIQQFRKRTVLRPDDLVKKGERLVPHVSGKIRIPLRVMFFPRLHVAQAAKVQPLRNKLPRSLFSSRVLQHPVCLGCCRLQVESSFVGGFEQFLIRRAAPEDVADP